MEVRLNRHTKLIIIASFIISTGLVLYVALNSNTHIKSMSENNSRLYSAYRISELLKSFKANLITLENKKRAYLGTGDPKFLEEFKHSESAAKNYLKEMEKYFSGKQEESKFNTLKDLTYQQIMGSTILSPQNDPAGFYGKETIREEASTLEKIDAVITEIDQSLSKTTKTLIENSVEYVTATSTWDILGVSLGLVVALTSLFLLLRDLSIRTHLESELRLAKKRADENASIKEQFMANMSHEIRTPMNAILGFTDLLIKNEHYESQMEYFNAIHTSGSNLLNIINDILDFSKIEAGKMTIEKVSFHLKDLLASLRLMFSEKASQKGIDFVVDVDKAIPDYVFGDPTRLTQILVNLINNAIKFTEAGQVKVSCDLKTLERNVVQVVFRVTDTGIGIPAEKINTIFERFNQASTDTTRKYGGTGLGLSIVKDLVELQNGEIKIKSKEKKGSQFIVTLSYPISEESHESFLTARKELKIVSKEPKQVLVVEDNKMNQKLALAYLKSFGLEIDVADNGLIALDKLKEKRYDLVLLDIQMPMLDGYSTAQRIRNELQLQLPVVAMTAHVMPGEREKCQRHGMNDYISKPFNENDLFQIVSRYLSEDEAAIPVMDDARSAKRVSSEPDGRIVNFDDVNKMGRGKKDFIVEMINMFIDENPQDIRLLEDAVQQESLTDIRDIAHRLKTPVGFMGLRAVSENLNTMEITAEKGLGIDIIRQLFKDVKRDSERAIGEFKESLLTRYK